MIGAYRIVDRSSHNLGVFEYAAKMHRFDRRATVATIRLCLIAIVLGGVSTIAACWCMALWAIAPVDGKQAAGLVSADTYRSSFYLSEGWACTRIGFAPTTAKDIGRSLIHSDDTRPPYWSAVGRWRGTVSDFQHPTTVNVELAYGWPLRAMKGLAEVDPRAGPYAGIRSTSGGFWLPPVSRPYGKTTGVHERILPLTPVLLGFTINSLLMGSLWLVAFLLIASARGSLRRRRGLCPACAYDLRATPAGSPCPECGERAAA